MQKVKGVIRLKTILYFSANNMDSFVNDITKERIEESVPSGMDGLYMVSAVNELRPLVSDFCDTRSDLINLLWQSRENPAENRVATQAIAQEFLKANKENRNLMEGILMQINEDNQLANIELALVEIFNPGKITVESETDSDAPPTVDVGLPDKNKKD